MTTARISSLALFIIALGLCLAPSQIDFYDSAMGRFDRTMGAILLICSILSLWDAWAPARTFVAVVGIGIATSPLWFWGTDISPIAVHAIVGLLVTGLALLMTAARPTRIGGGWRKLWSDDELSPAPITWS